MRHSDVAGAAATCASPREVQTLLHPATNRKRRNYARVDSAAPSNMHFCLQVGLGVLLVNASCNRSMAGWERRCNNREHGH
ncbi:hypothetical protein COCVIDRAFT_109281 [Bipolaris victoriae FI3]|uniref:Uncharacterized protein n=1 Tax=Bipolaris victoriae (strain FI3) TaxID=930091 RepID=W7E826_BIPV3|nr:hypothetical protein COCVIDRAFT_109281 [Bipolaris victoriae FI3]